MTKIVAISMPFPGVCRVLEESEKLGFLKLVKLDSDRVAIPPADTYLLGAWSPAYNQLLKVLEGSRVGVLWTSSCGELGFEPIEQDYLAAIIDNPAIKFVWFGDESLGKVFKKGFYAPYPMKLPEEGLIPHEKQDIVTLFCPNTAKKNIVNQLVAIALLQRTTSVVLHTNVPVDPVFAASIKLKYVQHSWLEEREYKELIASSKLNFACSWAETLNYQAAEALMLGTFSVLSTTIPWAMPYLTVKNPNDPLEIAQVAHKVLDTQERALTGYSVSEFHRSLRGHFVESNLFLKWMLESLAA